MDRLKRQKNNRTSSLNDKREHHAPITLPILTVENALRTESPFISVSEQIQNVVKREFGKIRSVHNS